MQKVMTRLDIAVRLAEEEPMRLVATSPLLVM